MFSQKFISMGVKGLAKLSEEHWGLLLILATKVGITFMRNKHYILVINITMMLQRKPLQLSQSLRNQIIPFHIKLIVPFRKDKNLIRRQLKYQLELSTLLGNKALLTEEQKKKLMIATLHEILEIFQLLFGRLLITILYLMNTSLYH